MQLKLLFCLFILDDIYLTRQNISLIHTNISKGLFGLFKLQNVFTIKKTCFWRYTNIIKNKNRGKRFI